MNLYQCVKTWEKQRKKTVTTWLTKVRANLSNSQSATDTWPDYSRFWRLTPYLEKGGQWKKEKILEIPRKKWLPKYRVNTFYIFEFPLFSLFTSIFFFLSDDFLWKVPACIYFTKINWKKVFILLTLGPHIKKKWQSLRNLSGRQEWGSL